VATPVGSKSATFPVTAKQQVLGVYNLFYKEARTTTSEERHMLATLGQHLGAAIETLRLASRDRELAIAEERNLLAQELHDSIAQALAADSTQLALALRGKEAYLGSCAMCHGAYGEGNGPMESQIQSQGKPPAALNDPILIDQLGREELIKIITQGGARSHLSNLMPSWGEKLSPELFVRQVAHFEASVLDGAPSVVTHADSRYAAATMSALLDSARDTTAMYPE